MAPRERRAARQLAHQRRRRRHRDEGTVAALGDQAPDAARCAGVQLQAQAAAIRAEKAQTIGDARQERRGRRQGPHQPPPHQPRQRPQPDMEDRQLPARAGVGVANAEALREQRRLRQVAGGDPAPAQSRQPHAPQAAPDMPARLVGDRPARAAQDRRHQGRAARRVVAGHDAEGDALDRSGLQRLLDDRAGDGRRGAGARADQHVRFQRRLGQAIDAAHEGRIVGEIEIVNAVADAAARPRHSPVPGTDRRRGPPRSWPPSPSTRSRSRRQSKARPSTPSSRARASTAARSRAAMVSAIPGSAASRRQSLLPNTPVPPRTRTRTRR